MRVSSAVITILSKVFENASMDTGYFTKMLHIKNIVQKKKRLNKNKNKNKEKNKIKQANKTKQVKKLK